MLSADGRFVAFVSEADNLVPGGAGGVFGDGPSWWPSISADGRYVAFQSQASNLVPGDTDGAADIFVHDRLTGSTELVSVEDDGYPMFADAQRPSISGDGRYVAFVAGSSSGQGTVFVRDRVAGHTITVSAAPGGAPANALSESPVISTNGQDVAFSSWASNLVPGDTNNASDIFVYDLPSAQVSQVSVGPSGEGNNTAFTPAISGDGRYVTFVSQAGNLTPETDETVLHLFVRDRAAEQTTLVSRAADGTSGNGDTLSSALDSTGRFIAYGTTATDIVPGQVAGRQDVLRYDQASGQTTVVPAGLGGAAPNGGSTTPTLDRTGRRIAYWSEASNLVPNDTNKLGDVFVTTR